ncbi:outer membrane beta-barrel protein [Paucibacter sp. AS339]|uniref:outer membrane beta-barrel protein n=1 Tax=Paucibacter hankyongi TaxID=3133434 RepID=UPI00309FAB45
MLFNRKFCGALMLCAAAGAASAQPYVGGNLSALVNTESDCGTQQSSSNDCGFKSRLGVKFYGGYLFEHVGVEGMVFGASGSNFRLNKGESRFDGFGGEAVYLVLPLRTDHFMLKGKLGAAYVKGSLVDFDKDKTVDKSSTQFLVGASVGVLMGKHWALNLDWDRIPVRFVDRNTVANMVSLGASYSF